MNVVFGVLFSVPETAALASGETGVFVDAGFPVTSSLAHTLDECVTAGWNEISTGKFCNRLAPASVSPASFGVILSAVRAGYIVLAVLAVGCSVVSAFFYLRVAVLMYMAEPEGSAPGRLPAAVSAALAVAAVVTIIGGIFPDTFAAWTVPP